MLVPLLLQVVAITHVTLIDPATASVRGDATVVIEGRRIREVTDGARAHVPAGARTIDGRGKFLIPGLWDMHVHTDVPGGRPLLSLYVANGVTGVRDMDGDLSTLRGWQRQITNGTLDGPRLVVSGPYLVGQNVPLPHLLVRSAAEGEAAVDSLARLGVDFVKVHNGMPPDAYFAVARAARRHGMVFAGHVFPPVTPEQASDSGQRSLEHLSGFPNPCSEADSALVRTAMPMQRFLLGACTNEPQGPVYARLAKNGTWVTPTLVVQQPVAQPSRRDWPTDSLRHYFGDSLQAMWKVMLSIPDGLPPAATTAGMRMFAMREEMVAALHRAGVHLLAGSDAPLPSGPPGFGLHEELAFLVQAGLTPMEALRTATSEPAAYLAATDSLGRVAPGMLADLVLLDADPTVDIANARRIAAVVMDGRVYDRKARQRLLDHVIASAHP
jgi:Amidohydrolase family